MCSYGNAVMCSRGTLLSNTGLSFQSLWINISIKDTNIPNVGVFNTIFFHSLLH
jgi:hypothetical protein